MPNHQIECIFEPQNENLLTWFAFAHASKRNTRNTRLTLFHVNFFSLCCCCIVIKFMFYFRFFSHFFRRRQKKKREKNERHKNYEMTYSAKMRDVEQLNQRIETTTRIESLQLADYGKLSRKCGNGPIFGCIFGNRTIHIWHRDCQKADDQ